MAFLRVAGIPRQRTAPKDCSPNLAAILPSDVQNKRGLMQLQSLRVEKGSHADLRREGAVGLVHLV